MGPGLFGNRKWLKESRPRLMGGLVSTTDGTDSHKLPHVGVHRGPQEFPLQHLKGAGGARMAGDMRRMCPLQDLGLGGIRHEEGVGRSISLIWARWTRLSIFKVREATTRLKGRIVSGSSDCSSGENCRDRASCFTFLHPGQ